ncbi:MAG: UDP-glucose dehydrogenase family protein [Candidatus Methanospirareceae archaeon]
MNLSIIGAGYVGLVTGACFAKRGHQVICVDLDERKIDMINRGQSPLYEDGLGEFLSTYGDKIAATTDYGSALANSDVTFICVGTPSADDGSIDLSSVRAAAEELGRSLKEKEGWHLVVVKSTVLPGTTQEVVLPLLERHSGKQAGIEFGLAMNPEFLREGVAINDFLNPDRIVIGFIDERSRDVLLELYEPFSCPIVETSLSGAEMIKYASNAFLAAKISFINELGNLCKRIDVDTYEVAEGMGYDKRIGRAFLDSGIGWGGSCFPKDLHALITWARELGEVPRLLEQVEAVNERQPERLIELLKRHVPDLTGRTIGVLGLAFKPGTDDIRESRAVPVVRHLIDEGAVVKVYDPAAMENFKQLFPDIVYCDSAEEALLADAVLILTSWEQFRALDFTGKVVIDGRHLAEARAIAKRYEGVCW